MRPLMMFTLLALAGSGVAAQSQPRVRHLDRFPTDLSVNSGSWILVPERLEGLPNIQKCAGQSTPARCGLAKIGTIGGSSWHWFWEVGPEHHSEGQLIEVTADGQVNVAWGLFFFGEIWLTQARLIEHANETFLLIPVLIPGTGAFTEDFLFAWKGSYWQEVDTKSWEKAIDLPPCYGIWKGPWIDFEKLSFDSQVWIDGDGNCCGSGGSVSVKFQIARDALRVTACSHTRGDGTPWDSWRQIDRTRCGPRPQTIQPTRDCLRRAPR